MGDTQVSAARATIPAHRIDALDSQKKSGLESNSQLFSHTIQGEATSEAQEKSAGELLHSQITESKPKASGFKHSLSAFVGSCTDYASSFVKKLVTFKPVTVLADNFLDIRIGVDLLNKGMNLLSNRVNGNVSPPPSVPIDIVSELSPSPSVPRPIGSASSEEGDAIEEESSQEPVPAPQSSTTEEVMVPSESIDSEVIEEEVVTSQAMEPLESAAMKGQEKASSNEREMLTSSERYRRNLSVFDSLAGASIQGMDSPILTRKSTERPVSLSLQDETKFAGSLLRSASMPSLNQELISLPAQEEILSHDSEVDSKNNEETESPSLNREEDSISVLALDAQESPAETSSLEEVSQATPVEPQKRRSRLGGIRHKLKGFIDKFPVFVKKILLKSPSLSNRVAPMASSEVTNAHRLSDIRNAKLEDDRSDHLEGVEILEPLYSEIIRENLLQENVDEHIYDHLLPKESEVVIDIGADDSQKLENQSVGDALEHLMSDIKTFYQVVKEENAIAPSERDEEAEAILDKIDLTRYNSQEFEDKSVGDILDQMLGDLRPFYGLVKEYNSDKSIDTSKSLEKMDALLSELEGMRSKEFKEKDDLYQLINNLYQEQKAVLHEQSLEKQKPIPKEPELYSKIRYSSASDDDFASRQRRKASRPPLVPLKEVTPPVDMLFPSASEKVDISDEVSVNNEDFYSLAEAAQEASLDDINADDNNSIYSLAGAYSTSQNQLFQDEEGNSYTQDPTQGFHQEGGLYVEIPRDRRGEESSFFAQEERKKVKKELPPNVPAPRDELFPEDNESIVG